ncbi:hypothetical protein [Nocardioides sp. B-3]|uniref:hypothetical protein n=1 Tax=Nocardioides sp. B-3 TaxID=2895565 RepID=UPI0021521596|nr:hypothetical protein [Nocardioides sp. B-3]UUZ60079.1 hypothetical protein LP418_03605 [Nocardioides sp. B-3]
MGTVPSRREDPARLAKAGVPWLARRAGDLGPRGARMALAELGARRDPLRDEAVA